MYSPRENYMDYSKPWQPFFFWPKMWQGGDNEYMHWKACDMKMSASDWE